MQESFRFIDEHHSGVTGHDFCDHAREGLHAIACLINDLSVCMESDGVRVNAPLLHVVSWSSIRESNAQLTQIGRVQDEMTTEGIEHDSPYFMAFGVVSEENLKAALRRTLKIASTLLPHQADATAAVKHQCEVRQVPLTECRDVRGGDLNEPLERCNLHLLPTVLTAHENMVDMLRLTWMGRLANPLDRLRCAFPG